MVNSLDVLHILSYISCSLNNNILLTFDIAPLKIECMYDNIIKTCYPEGWEKGHYLL